MADMDKLEQRRTLKSLILFFKCFKLDRPNYISQYLKTPWLTKYNLRDNALNVVQPPYNSLVMHNSYLYMIAHIWNQQRTATKSSSTLAQFRARLNRVPLYDLYIALSIFTLFLILGLVSLRKVSNSIF